ncbi:DUF6192 family protein [Streptomyces sp. NPDC015345]|uniref:DUF6192 family protein n=1 Tax=Streptomyces sp. NPDC015345 TaxID=3364953 RepID=UPI0036F61FF2
MPRRLARQRRLFAVALAQGRTGDPVRPHCRWSLPVCTANRWPKDRRKEGASFTVHRILASVADEGERWAAIEYAPFNPRTGARQWTPDGAKRVVGQRVDRPVTLDEKVATVADLTRDDEVAADLLKRPKVSEHVTPAEKMRMVTELTRDDDTVQEVTLGWIMNARRNARDYERLPQHAEAHLNWAFIMLRTRRLTPTGAPRAGRRSRRAAWSSALPGPVYGPRTTGFSLGPSAISSSRAAARSRGPNSSGPW